MRVVFSNRAYAAILAETTEKIKTETGGLFLGTFKDDTWYVIEAIDPGPKSVFEVAYFEYDQKYTQHLINKIANLYEEKLLLTGLWHRHPGSFDQFSSTDDDTNSKYAKLNPNGAVSALVNVDPKFRLTVFHVAKPCRYSKIDYCVGDNFIPARLLKLKSPERFENLIYRMIYPSKATSDQEKYHRSVSMASFMRFVSPLLREEKCLSVDTSDLMDEDEVSGKIVETLMDDILFLTDERGIELSIQRNDQYVDIVQDAIDGPVTLRFMQPKAAHGIIFTYKNDCYYYRNGLLRAIFNEIVATQTL